MTIILSFKILFTEFVIFSILSAIWQEFVCESDSVLLEIGVILIWWLLAIAIVGQILYTIWIL